MRKKAARKQASAERIWLAHNHQIFLVFCYSAPVAYDSAIFCHPPQLSLINLLSDPNIHTNFYPQRKKKKKNDSTTCKQHKIWEKSMVRSLVRVRSSLKHQRSVFVSLSLFFLPPPSQRLTFKNVLPLPKSIPTFIRDHHELTWTLYRLSPKRRRRRPRAAPRRESHIPDDSSMLQWRVASARLVFSHSHWNPRAKIIIVIIISTGSWVRGGGLGRRMGAGAGQGRQKQIPPKICWKFFLGRGVALERDYQGRKKKICSGGKLC